MSEAHARRDWLTPIFLALVALQALLVILDRVGVSMPIPARAMSGVRLAVALQVLALLAVGAFRRSAERKPNNRPAA